MSPIDGPSKRLFFERLPDDGSEDQEGQCYPEHLVVQRLNGNVDDKPMPSTHSTAKSRYSESRCRRRIVVDFLVPMTTSGQKGLMLRCSNWVRFVNPANILQLMIVFPLLTLSNTCETAAGSDAHTITSAIDQHRPPHYTLRLNNKLKGSNYDFGQAAACQSGERNKEPRTQKPSRKGSVAAELTQARPHGKDAHHSR